MKTLVGLIPDSEHAAAAEAAMKNAGLGEDKISALARPAEVWQRLGGHRKMRVVFKYVLAGALLGLVVASLYGLPASIMNCIHQGCPFSANLGFLIAIYLFWIIGGAFMGAHIGLDRLEQDMYSYVEGVRRGGSLMVAETPDEETVEVTEIMEHEGGLLVHPLEDDQENHGG
jgi:hypothetical protein